MDINTLRKENELIDLFCSLAEIPSPSLKEENLANRILEYCKDKNLNCELDAYKNVHITVNATDETKQPILLSAHMDVIGDDSPVKIHLDGDLIKAEGRTAADSVEVFPPQSPAHHTGGSHAKKIIHGIECQEDGRRQRNAGILNRVVKHSHKIGISQII